MELLLERRLYVFGLTLLSVECPQVLSCVEVEGKKKGKEETISVLRWRQKERKKSGGSLFIKIFHFLHSDQTDQTRDAYFFYVE